MVAHAHSFLLFIHFKLLTLVLTVKYRTAVACSAKVLFSLLDELSNSKLSELSGALRTLRLFIFNNQSYK